jgi:predicted nucleic acid-binding protein
MSVLVDTSVWSLALRRKAGSLNKREAALAQELHDLMKEGRVRIIGAIRQELLRGARTSENFETVKEKLRRFPDLVPETEDYERAAELELPLRQSGISGAPTDLLICAVALAHNLAIFTTDKDFEHFRKVIPLQLHVPARAP